MKRILVVPAAGRGTRLGSEQPKFLYPLCGKALIDHVLAIYANVIDEAIVVVSPNALALAQRHFDKSDGKQKAGLTVAVQKQPTGMLDAILEAAPRIYDMKPERIWVTWCDQVAIQSETVQRMVTIEESGGKTAPEMVVPVIEKHEPYIHFPVDSAGRVTGVLQRREGDAMPVIGNNDMGLFSMSFSAFERLDKEFANLTDLGEGTGERNFLPFIPWLAARGQVVLTDGSDEIETLGVNTVDEAKQIERSLQDARPFGKAGLKTG